MAVGTTKGFPKELDKSIDKIYFMRYMEAPAEFDKVFTVVPSFEGKSIKESELSGIEVLRTVPEGGRVSFATLVEGNEKEREPTQYGLGYQVTQNMYEDDTRWGYVKTAAKELADSAAYKRETVAWDLFNNGFATHVAWDDNYIWVASGRTVLNGGDTMNNRPSVDAALSETSLNAAMEYYKKAKGSSGRPINIRMNLLIVPIELGSLAWQLNTNVKATGTMDNDLNILKRDGKWSVHESRHLTSTTAWFTVSAEHGFMFAWKRNTAFQRSDDFETGNRLEKVTSRFMAYLNDPTGTYATTGA